LSEQVTHLALADDVRLLCLASPRVCDEIRDVLREDQAKMRLGALTRGSESFAGPMVKELCGRKDDPKPRDGEKLAFCLGTMAHRAADRMMKPIFDSQSADGECDWRDISVYHDVFLFDRIYGRGKSEPYAPGALEPKLRFPKVPGLDAETAEEFFRVMFQRAMLSAHTLIPDYSDPEGWLDKLFGKLQEMSLDVRRYHEAVTNPDEEIFRRAIVDVNFYDDKDPVIALVRDLRDSVEISEAEFLERWRLRDHDSLYSRGVAKGYGYVQVTSEYWAGEAREELFLDAIRR